MRNLSPDPARIERYAVAADRSRALASDLLMRRVVSGPILRTDGKQNIKPCTKHGVLFNVSHDEDIVVLGSHATISLGIDIMKIQISPGNKNCETMFSTLHAIFSKTEWAFINNDLARFYYLWTAKEAYVKCLGTGLFIEPQDIETFAWTQRGSEWDIQIRNACNFKIKILTNLVKEYVVAVCTGPVAECDASWVSQIKLPVLETPIQYDIKVIEMHVDDLCQ